METMTVFAATGDSVSARTAVARVVLIGREHKVLPIERG